MATSSSTEIVTELGSPLDTIPFNLQQLVAEKMPYKDFATFNGCSSSSASVCDKHPAHVGIVMEIDDLTIRAKRVTLQDSRLVTLFGEKECTLSDLPPYARLRCREVTISCFFDFGLVEKRVVKAEGIVISSQDISDDLMRRVVQLMKPQGLIGLEGYFSQELLLLPEIQQLSLLFARSLEEMEDSVLLGLNACRMTIAGTVFSTKGISAFLQQWLSGNREIDWVTIQSNDGVLDELMKLLDPKKCTRKPGDTTTCLCLCRAQEHTDCLLITVMEVFPPTLVIEHFFTDERCPAAEWKRCL